MYTGNSGNRVNVIMCDSLDEMMTDLIAVPLEKRYKLDKRGLGGDWIGRTFLSFEEVRDALQSPWRVGNDEYQKMLDQLREEKIEAPKSIKRKAVWNEEEGDEFDYDRYRAGTSHLRTTRRERRHAIQQVTIICNTAISCGEKSLNLLWRAAATVCLTTLLEEAGYRVELWGVCHTTGAFVKSRRDPYKLNFLGEFGGSIDILSAVNLKRPEDMIDEVALINTLSGWSFRTMFLGSYHLWDEPGVEISYGYGTPTALGKRVEEITHDPQVITCERVLDRQAAIKWVKDQLKELEEGKSV